MSTPPLSEADLAKVKYAATCMCRDNPCRCTRGAGPVMTLRLVAEIERLWALAEVQS